MTMTTERPNVSAVILDVTGWIHALERLTTDPDFGAWRHEEEAGALLQCLLAARSRAEDMRLLKPDEQASRVRMLLNGLPLARLRQLLGDGDEAA